MDFPIYNPYLEIVPSARGKKGGYKVYDVDGMGNGAINVSPKLVPTVKSLGQPFFINLLVEGIYN